ncbi:MAG: redoxin domain-containing protein [Phaeodactylibacter sp.]|nr:redoxin domain-containing protein [Phaeodactylibacter sp.]
MVVKGSIDNELLYDSRRFEANQRPKYDQITAKLNSLQKGTVEYDDAKGEQNAMLDERKAYLEGIYKKYPNTLFTSFKRAGQNPEVEEQLNPDGTPDVKKRVWMYRTQFWEGVDFTDERLLRTPVISNKLKRYIDELTPQNADSILSAAYFLVDQVPTNSDYYKYFVNWIVINFDPLETTLMDPQAVFTNMIQKYFTYDKAFWADSVEVYSLQQRAHEMAASLLNKKGPNVSATDINGKTQSIYDIKAPYIVVYMYNPDCEHCAEQTPKLVDFYKEWKSKGVEVYGIAVDTEDDKWRKYVKDNKMDWINVFDPTNRAIYATYFVDHTPEIYVLNPDRTIIAKNLKVHQIAEMIEKDKEK